MPFNENNKQSNADSDDDDIDLDFDDEDDDDSAGENDAPAWLASYSDMMTDLMAIFVILFAFAMISTSSENHKIKDELQDIKNETSISSTATGYADDPIKNRTSISPTATGYEDDPQIDDEFDRIFESIKKKIEQSGYSESILLEKNKEYIKFQFKDNVLFYPDSSVMRETSFGVLQYMGDLLLSIDSDIGSIDISGHTAKAGEDSKTNFFAWELSSDRAIAVLKFFVKKCDLPQSKMVISGYSHYDPVSGNDPEETRSLNRRVEIKIVRATLKL